MHSTLIVARFATDSTTEVATLFGDFDNTDMPYRMGTLRRQLFSYQGLYFHLQDFADDNGGERIDAAKTDERFQAISANLRPHLVAYDPDTWRSPADAIATRIYNWEQQP
ncbi:TcmI family type II polyketide cyclase [Actinophytocola sediminis]